MQSVHCISNAYLTAVVSDDNVLAILVVELSMVRADKTLDSECDASKPYRHGHVPTTNVMKHNQEIR